MWHPATMLGTEDPATIDYRLSTIDYRLSTIDYRLSTIDYGEEPTTENEKICPLMIAAKGIAKAAAASAGARVIGSPACPGLPRPGLCLVGRRRGAVRHSELRGWKALVRAYTRRCGDSTLSKV